MLSYIADEAALKQLTKDAMRTIGAGIDQALAMLPGRQLLHKLLSQPLLPIAHGSFLGTPEAFHKDCLSSSDGRSVRKNYKSLGKLLAGTYNGGGEPSGGSQKTDSPAGA